MKEQQKLKDAIREIIESINPGWYFDSHTVIFLLLQEHSDEYLSGAEGFASTELYHSGISKIVQSNSDLIEDTGMEVYSKNIHDNFSECRLWLRTVAAPHA
jgi:hypothetical protein